MMALFEGGCAKHATLVGDMMIRHGIFGPNIIYIYILYLHVNHQVDGGALSL
jgi:hypothetical protein